MARSIVPSLALAALFPLLSQAEITPGEILISEMNCVACHEVPADLKARLASRPSPRLGADGVRITPQWLRQFLADPQKTKPGTLMPDMLHSEPPEKKGEVVEALTHFLVSMQTAGAPSQVAASGAKVEAGKALYHDLGCVQCHAPFQLPKGKEEDAAAKEEFARLQDASVPLAGPAAASKYQVAELARFLMDPLKSRPGGRMPSLNLNGSEAEAIAMFLLRDQVPAGQPVLLEGLKYEYYDKDFPELPEFDRLTPDDTGVVDRPTLKMITKKKSYALRFQGNITVPKPGKYKFYTQSDDGTRLLIDGKLVVDNGGIHPSQERSGEIDLKTGVHSLVLTYFQGGGEAEMKVQWKGPGFERQDIPANVISHDGKPMVPTGDAPFTPDAAKVSAGAKYYIGLQCNRCHGDLPGGSTVDVARPTAKALTQLRARQPAGCLSANPKGNAAKFEINDRQRLVIQSLLQTQEVLTVALTPEEEVRRTMTMLNCYACHQRDRRGGAEGIRREYLTSFGEVDLGDEGRIPPHLNGVGAKLQPGWMKTVLDRGEKVRPYMATRMPKFGPGNVSRLPELLDRVDTAAEAKAQPDVFAPGMADSANKFGRKLVGAGGLTCIACHDFAGNKSLGVPALDLATTGGRLKWDWFRRYLLNPPALRPETRMPSFWPEGVAVNKEVLGGDTEKQIAAIWAYLARKNFTDLPAGLVQGKQEIVATTEAVIYRNFIDGGGPRAIGVGYPEKANLCFDANEMRLALLWQGPFIDAARHRTGRGSGYEKPLGTNVIKGPPGPPLAILPSESAPWPDTSGKAAGYQFHGYTLDEKQRPAFRYNFDNIEVVDFPMAVPGEVDADVKRTITIKSGMPVSNLYFRAAVGAKIEEKDGAFLVDDRIRMTFTGAQPRTRTSDGKTELLVPLALTNGEATFTETISW